ncbi:MAG TPA: class I SAM-dependent methyltransferase [Candidatus Polarisedimenticolia bacterium]|nr:class I SAM-dependent methyltransferase [Candidatus Polarisedimenticolia bacterium]
MAEESEAAALARLYDVDLVEDPGDLELYLALARRTGDPIIELAAGSGRLSVPLAAAGHRVTALDIDPAMLSRARSAATRAGADVAARIELLEADLLQMPGARAGEFQLAILALNSLLLLGSRDAQRRAIASMAGLLAPGGVAVVDVWQPGADDLARFDGRLMLEYQRRDPETGLEVTKTAAAWLDASTGGLALTAIYDEGLPGDPPRRWSRTDRLRLIAADELSGFAEDAGLIVERLGGDYELNPAAAGAERSILVAVRPSRA